MTKQRVLSGVQPTGNLHLGNYLGAIRNWVGLQDSHECLFMLADLHAITVPQDPAELTKNTRETAAAYIACGIDPAKSIIFPQSAVSMHAELAWILSCHTPLGWLRRMTQFKEKAKIGSNSEELEKFIFDNFKLSKKIESFSDHLIKRIEKITSPDSFMSKDELNACHESLRNLKNDREELQKLSKDALAILDSDNKRFANTNLGLLSYPVLMAADIIGYHATHVPVGEDQKQHLELARDIAGAFNRAYGEFFPLPEPLIMPTAARIMSLRDGTKKMSKSDPSDYSRITLTDDADAIAQKIRKAKSDMVEGISYEPDTRPEVANLLTIYGALSGTTAVQVAEQMQGIGANFSTFKGMLVDLAVAQLAPITAKMRTLMDDTYTLDVILKSGAEKARDIAGPILTETMNRIGFLRLS